MHFLLKDDRGSRPRRACEHALESSLSELLDRSISIWRNAAVVCPARLKPVTSRASITHRHVNVEADLRIHVCPGCVVNVLVSEGVVAEKEPIGSVVIILHYHSSDGVALPQQRCCPGRTEVCSTLQRNICKGGICGHIQTVGTSPPDTHNKGTAAEATRIEISSELPAALVPTKGMRSIPKPVGLAQSFVQFLQKSVWSLGHAWVPTDQHLQP